jgi:predicted amidohydrolase
MSSNHCQCCQRLFVPGPCDGWACRAACGDTRRLRARHDLVRHSRVFRQFAGHAVSAVGDEQFLTLGYSLEQVVTVVTSAPAKIINRAPKIGTLQIGAPGDVAIMEVVEGPVSLVDTRNNRRDGKAYLKPIQTVINGVPFGRPYQSPFAVR